MKTTTQSTSTREKNVADEKGNASSSGSQESSGNFREEAREAATESFQHARREGGKLLSQAKESVHNAANDKLNEAASRVRNVEKAARDAADRLGDGENSALKSGAESLATNVSKVADYLEHNQPEEVIDDARNLVREHPVATFGTLLAAGFLAGRFLKASEPRPEYEPDEMTADLEPHHIPQ